MDRFIKLLILFAVLYGVAFGAEAKKESSPPQSSFAIYYVDMQRVINESGKGRQAKSLLESKIATAKKKIKQMEQEINKLKEELKSPVLSNQARAEKETKLQQKIRDLSRFRQDAQIEIVNLEKQYTAEIINDVVKIIRDYREKKGIPVIVEIRESGIIAADPKYDLTDTIIKLYDKQAEQ
jgi:outer membrane protein